MQHTLEKEAKVSQAQLNEERNLTWRTRSKPRFTDSSELRSEKLSLPKTTSDDGITIDFGPIRENADPANISGIETFVL
jgi:hypothetical protein